MVRLGAFPHGDFEDKVEVQPKYFRGRALFGFGDIILVLK